LIFLESDTRTVEPGVFEKTGQGVRLGTVFVPSDAAVLAVLEGSFAPEARAHMQHRVATRAVVSIGVQIPGL
jgi:hypothetical protein